MLKSVKHWPHWVLTLIGLTLFFFIAKTLGKN